MTKIGTHHPIQLTKLSNQRGRWGVARVYESTLGGTLFLTLVMTEQHFSSAHGAQRRAEELNIQKKVPR